MNLVRTTEGFEETDLQRKLLEARNIPAGGWIFAAFCGTRQSPVGEDKTAPIGPAASFHRTSRKFHFDALPAPAAEAARLRPGAAVAAAPAGCRTSSSRPVCHRRSGRSGHRDRHAPSRSWARVWSAPRRAKRSGERQTPVSSSASLDLCPAFV